ncbi:unnamed protein product [Fusarium fujikuroi]|uniref:DUF7703 domain-containing protein n=1 Tax=Fusarium fujikuroi TaxID=5127 RepID=A0A9Q9UHJ6_FUSFU|nr:unnamed protein product [Fusarium fujikuroi]
MLRSFMCQAAFTVLSMLFYQHYVHDTPGFFRLSTMMLPHRDKWDAHYSTIDETVYIGRDVFVVVASTLSLYNAIELLTLISLTFKRRSGLYFWSILIASFGIIPYCLGWLVVYFDLTHDYVGMIIETVGWVLVISGQSVVLYSRLHLIVTDVKILRAVLIMIIINGLVWHTTMTVLLFGSEYSPSDNRKGFNNIFNIMEKISMSIFYLQELIISGLYIWKSMEILRTAFGNTKSMLYKLFTINFVIILMDIALVAIEFHDLYVWEQGIKLVTYSIKLKLEFAVLSELIEFVRNRSGTRSRPTKDSENQSTLVPLSSMHKGNTKGTMSSTRDFIHAGDSRTNTTIAAANPIPAVPTNDSIHVLREVDVESLSAYPGNNPKFSSPLRPTHLSSPIMEPISLAFEITSLSMQLVGMVKTIKGLVTAYNSAAQELEELCLKLEDIEITCNCLGAALSQANGLTRIPELPPLLKRVKGSIQDCYDKVSKVNQVIAKVYAKVESNRNPLRTMGSSFLRYRSQLATCVGSLDDSRSTLNYNMNLMSLIISNERVPRTVLISGADPTSAPHLRICHRPTQDLLSQGLLTPATVVTYTEYDPENEASLLGLALSLRSRKILNFLKYQLDLSDSRNHVACFNFQYRHSGSEEDLACYVEYIHLRGGLMTTSELGVLLLTSKAWHITTCLEACRQYFPYNWDCFDDVILSGLSYGFSQLSTRQMSNTQLEDWAPLFTEIVARNQDLLANPQYHRFTANLWFMLWYSFDPDDAWYRVCHWVDLLELAQIDIAMYLKVAINYCSNRWVETQARGFGEFEDSAVRRELSSRYHKGREIPCWIEVADSSCPIRELLTEFPALRYMDDQILQGGWGLRTGAYKHLKSGTNLEASHFSMMYWPVLPSLNRYSSVGGGRNNRPYLADWADRACELQERRFERREHPMQLVQTAKAVKEHIAAYKSAAKELESLADKLDDIETICCSLEIILSDGTQNSSSLEVNLLKKLNRIIQQCLSQVSDIHSILDTISRMQKNTRNPLKTIGALFLRHRDQIRFATNGLDRCLSSLQLHMTANILYSTPSLRPAIFLLILQGRDYDVPEGCQRPFANHNYFAFNSSSMLSLYVKLSLRRGSLAPFCITLQIPRVIYIQEGQRQIGEKVESAFMDDNLSQIKTYFTQGILTPATVIAWDEYDPDNETSLLGLAALTKSQSILKFLATQTSDLSSRNHIGGARYLYAFNGEDGPRCVLEYIKIRQDSILASEFHMILLGIVDHYNAQICVEACKPHFSSNMVAFNTAVWRYAMKQFRHDSTVSVEGWAGLVADCVSRGLDIDQQLRCDTDFSVLKDILFYNWDTDEILEQIHLWIDILEEAGISIKEYLMVETECCFTTWRDTPYWINKKVGSSNYRRVLFIKELRGRQFPFWDLSIHDECPVKELLTEHEHFATPLTMYPGGSTQAFIAQHEAWKKYQTLSLSDGSDRYLKRWPFWLPLRYYNDHSEEEAEWVARELQVAGKRFDRKQKRKERKAGRCWQKQRIPMPGAWVENV